MSIIPLHLQRLFERRWAARFGSLVIPAVPKKHRIEGPPSTLRRAQQPFLSCFFNGDRLAELVTGIVVHEDRLIISLKSDVADDESDSSDARSLTIP
jgi:hypothetical protein